jgi:nicotinate phosphoribosyltransferase
MLSPDFSSLRPQDYGLLTDLYQFTMAACYVGEGLESQPAAFELFVRRLPTDYGYLIAMGLTQAVDYLQQLSFAPEALRALRETGIFADAPERFWELLARCRFEGDVWAVPEGTAIFANQPLLRVEAPLWQAQLVETYLLSTFNYQTLIATKAARMRDAAGDEAILLEFGTRRAFGPQAGLWAARAALAAGFNATSNVLAALKLGRKPAGTMAHSLVMAIAALSGDETRAFQSFRRYFPQAALLIDTYDPIQGARTAAQLFAARSPDQLGSQGEIGGVRIDSGDLEDLSRRVKQILPQGAPVFVSGDLECTNWWKSMGSQWPKLPLPKPPFPVASRSFAALKETCWAMLTSPRLLATNRSCAKLWKKGCCWIPCRIWKPLPAPAAPLCCACPRECDNCASRIPGPQP